MKKVGIFFSLNSYGGVQTCIISLIKGLNQIGIIPDLLSDEAINQKIVAEHNLKVILQPITFSVSKKNKDKLNNYLQGAIDLIYFYKTSWLKKQYDFLYIFQPNIIINSKVKYMYYLSMSPRSPGFSGKQLLPKIKFFVYDYLLKFFIPTYEFKKRTPHCVINSNYTAKLYEENYQEKIDVVYPSNLVEIKSPVNYAIKDTITFLSRISPYKRPEMLIKLSEEFRDKNFEIIGAPENENFLNQLQQLIDSKKLTNIKILTNLPYATLVEHLLKTKFYVFTARDEHFGITTVEAMLYGAIPFVHNSGGQKEIVPYEELRFEDDEFVEKFRLLINKPENELMEIRQKLSKHVMKFSEQVYIKKMLSFLDKI
ncbi:MAG: glycosyltransferase [Bacteroidia bacterium]|nr:glycosyltransferase [Bacteroidia bacterium]